MVGPMRRLGQRNTWITIFVIIWIAVFHYETLRLNYFTLLACREFPLSARLKAVVHSDLFRQLSSQCPPLPKLKFLYPPAGWIMFFNVDRSYGFAEVYGLKGGHPTLIDPHEIFETRFVGYDNINRNVLVSVLSAADGPRFCPYLQRNFPQYEHFAVVYARYPDLIEQPNEILRGIVYQCP